MHPPTQFRFEGFQLASHPISARLALQQEAPRPRPAADVREAQKVFHKTLSRICVPGIYVPQNVGAAPGVPGASI
jgi:hypothetical protein